VSLINACDDDDNNNNNIQIPMTPYGRNFRGVGSRSDHCYWTCAV